MAFKQLNIRLPSWLQDALRVRAKQNNRTLSQEIQHRLEQHDPTIVTASGVKIAAPKRKA